jgi:hypothetical protein
MVIKVVGIFKVKSPMIVPKVTTGLAQSLQSLQPVPFRLSMQLNLASEANSVRRFQSVAHRYEHGFLVEKIAAPSHGFA